MATLLLSTSLEYCPSAVRQPGTIQSQPTVPPIPATHASASRKDKYRALHLTRLSVHTCFNRVSTPSQGLKLAGGVDRGLGHASPAAAAAADCPCHSSREHAAFRVYWVGGKASLNYGDCHVLNTRTHCRHATHCGGCSGAPRPPSESACLLQIPTEPSSAG